MTPPAAVTSAVMPVMSAVTFSGVHMISPIRKYR